MQRKPIGILLSCKKALLTQQWYNQIYSVAVGKSASCLVRAACIQKSDCSEFQILFWKILAQKHRELAGNRCDDVKFL